MNRTNPGQYRGPGFRDWLLLVLGIAFVVSGLVLLRRKPDVAVPCLALFGVCSVVSANNVLRKRRFARFGPMTVEIVGGTPIRPLRSRIGLLGATLLALGIVLLSYWHSGPILVLACILVMAAGGAALLIGLLFGYLPVGFLQFDPDGMTVGSRGYSISLPWDAIAGVGPGEFHDNPVLLLWLNDLNRVGVQPSRARARALANLASSQRWVGAHVMIMSSHYGIELPYLVSAIERYLAEPQARQGLAVPRLPASK